MMTHAGMLKPRKDQSIFAHSPEPEKTISNISASGKFSTMKSSPGPHPGTFSGGRFCNHTCLDATRIPERDVTSINKPMMSLEYRLFIGKEPIKNINPSKMVEILWNMHIGQGSRPRTCSAYNA